MKLEDLNPTDGGSYFLIDCPKCGEHEAFVYKDDIEKAKKNPKYKIHWICNRLNKCGARGTLDELDAEQINPVHLVKKNDSSLTESQIQTLQALISIELSTKKEDAGKYNFDIRGISRDTLVKNDVIYYPYGFQNFLQKKYGKNLQKKFLSKHYADRDILFPILGIDGKTERILLRSKSKKLEKKEIQVKLTERASEIWNQKCLSDKNTKFVFICEGVYDALSILEVASDVPSIGAIALSGSRKFKKAITEILNNKNCDNQRFVLCLDNDKAGIDEVHLLKEVFKIDFVTLNLHQYKDVNEFLQNDYHALYISVIEAAKKSGKQKSLHDMQKEKINKQIKNKSVRVKENRSQKTIQKYLKGKEKREDKNKAKKAIKTYLKSKQKASE